jgi:outer membrane protein assembly factor BamB
MSSAGSAFIATLRFLPFGLLLVSACGRSPLRGGRAESSDTLGGVSGTSTTSGSSGAGAGENARGGMGSGAGQGGAGGAAGVAAEAGRANPWPDPPDEKTTASAYQVNAAHTGAQPTDDLDVQLEERWVRDFGTVNISYPLIARGRVYVVVNGASLYALTLEGGETVWGPRVVGKLGTSTCPTYERGRIFTVDVYGRVRALSSETGGELWSTMLGTGSTIGFNRAIPVAYDGTVYLGGDYLFYALDGATGSVKWTAQVETCWTSGPAVGPAGAFIACLCDHVYGFDASTGQERWAQPGVCVGGGGGAPLLLAGGFVYTRDRGGNLVLNAETGELVGTHAAGPIPAASGEFLYSVNDGVLFAHRAGLAAPAWTFGDGRLTTAPLVTGPHVVVGSAEGHLSVVGALEGELENQITMPDGFPIANDITGNVVPPCIGMNVAEDRIVVPNGTSLFVY